MNLVQAKLIKLKTFDGLVELKDDIQIGKLYLIDLDTLRIHQRLFNIKKQCYHYKDIVYAVNEETMEEEGWMVIEVLEILGDKN